MNKDLWREAMLYEQHDNQSVICYLCPHQCRINEGGQGICNVRENRQGKLYTLAFGRTVAQHIDSVEKKPLFHFHPGTKTYSLATHGCNFHCQYCTNWEVSQMPNMHFEQFGVMAQPNEIVTAALKANCKSIAYTYVEPTIFFEYINEIATLATAAGLLNLWKTNGFMSMEMLEIAIPNLNAANVDLKAFRDATYQQFGGRLSPILDRLQQMKRSGVWVEITTVIIPGLNDDRQEIRDMAEFIAQELGVDTPWHIARFFPAYQMQTVAPTSMETLEQAYEIGKMAGLHHVYFNNVLIKGKQDTVCNGCGFTLIRRHGFSLLENHIQSGRCPRCQSFVAGIGLDLNILDPNTEEV